LKAQCSARGAAHGATATLSKVAVVDRLTAPRYARKSDVLNYIKEQPASKGRSRKNFYIFPASSKKFSL
jgi:hypothetical protein